MKKNTFPNSSPKLGEVAVGRRSVLASSCAVPSHTPSPLRGTPSNLEGELGDDLQPILHIQNSSPKLGEVAVGRRSVLASSCAAPSHTPSPLWGTPSNLEGELGNDSHALSRTHNLASRKEMRRELRTYGTAAEATLWKMLKGRQVMGKQFRRQFSIGPYVLDFYCPEVRLCVELDGQPHFTPEGEVYDAARDEYLLIHGIRILRFENCAVFQNPHGLLAEIEDAIQNSIYYHTNNNNDE